MITFKAQHISSPTIKRKNNPYKASFVQLNPLSYNDMVTINNTVLDWNSPYKIIDDIAVASNHIYLKNTESPNQYFYALTTQDENFEKIKHGSILGIIKLSKNNDTDIYIDSFEVAPKFSHDTKNSEFRGIGTAIINNVKNLFNKYEMFVKSEYSAIPFYEKNGFELLGKRTLMKLIK